MTYVFKSLKDKNFSTYVDVEGEPLLIEFQNFYCETDDNKIGQALLESKECGKRFEEYHTLKAKDEAEKIIEREVKNFKEEPIKMSFKKVKQTKKGK